MNLKCSAIVYRIIAFYTRNLNGCVNICQLSESRMTRIARGFVGFPVEQIFSAGVPRHAVEKVEELRDPEELCGGEHLRRFAMVTTDLLDTEC